MSPPADSQLDAGRILRTLDRHGVEYLVVGGVAAELHGASRPTFDVDCLPRRTDANLDRLAAAMRELGARLRSEGLTDDEAKRLPTQVDRVTLASLEISTWTTDAGDFDVLADLPDRDGRHLGYEELVPRSARTHPPEVHVGGGRSVPIAERRNRVDARVAELVDAGGMIRNLRRTHSPTTTTSS